MSDNQPSLSRITPDDDPMQVFEEMRAVSQDLYWDEDSGAWCAIGHETVRTILNDHEKFGSQHLNTSAEPVLGARVLAQITGSEHDHKKAAALKSISHVAMDSYYLPAVEETARRLWADQKEKRSFDFVESISEPFSIEVTCRLIGLDPRQSRRFLPWNRSVVAFITTLHRDPKDSAHQLRDAALFRAFIRRLITARTRKPHDDLLSYLAVEGQQAGFSTDEIVALIINIFLAASEPLGKTLAYCTFEILRSPEITAKVSADSDVLPAIIAESLRLHSPVQIIPRIVNDNVEVAGRELRPGDLVFCLVGAANRDPRVFTDPDRFSLNRPELVVKSAFSPSSRHNSFGSGLHFCIGAMLAKRQLHAGLCASLPYLHRWRLTDERFPERGLYTRGPVRLDLTLRDSEVR